MLVFERHKQVQPPAELKQLLHIHSQTQAWHVVLQAWRTQAWGEGVQLPLCSD
jgi:hypothetical protein